MEEFYKKQRERAEKEKKQIVYKDKTDALFDKITNRCEFEMDKEVDLCQYLETVSFLLGVRQNSRNLFILLGGSAVEGTLYITSSLLFGENSAQSCYALIIHLPLIMFLMFYYKYSFVSSCISVFSAYLCCQLSNWVGLLMLSITKAEWCYYSARILITVVTFIFICRFVCRTTETIFTRDTKELYVIGFLPTAYYISDYTFTKLSDLLYSSNKLIVESMGFALCIFYFAFLFIYFHQYENKQEIR